MIDTPLRSASPASSDGAPCRLHEDEFAQRSLAVANGSDFASLMKEVDFLMEKGFPLGLAVIIGDIDISLCRQIKRAAARQADYLNWATRGTLLIAVFRKGLADELSRAWRMVAPQQRDLAAGVVFSDCLNNHGELLAAARIALQQAILRSVDLLVLDPAEARQAIDGPITEKDGVSGRSGRAAH